MIGQHRGLGDPFRNGHQPQRAVLDRVPDIVGDPIPVRNVLSVLVANPIAPEINALEEGAVTHPFDINVFIFTVRRHPGNPARRVLQSSVNWAPDSS